jgi:hypothetical protein
VMVETTVAPAPFIYLRYLGRKTLAYCQFKGIISKKG